MTDIRLLRGRVFIRPTGDNYGYAESLKRAGLVMPQNYEIERTQKGQCVRGIVVAMGPPAFARDQETEIPPDFKVGDEVLHLGMNDSRWVMWNDERLRACAQEEVLGVIER